MNIPVSFSLPLRKNPYKGRYISIEGIDGSGKSTQLHLLREYFEKKGETVVLTSEPKSGQIVEQLIRKILGAEIKIPTAAWQFLYSADRGMNHAELVEPALKQGHMVLSHRSFWSVVPYGIMDKSGYASEKKEDAIGKTLLVSQGILSHYKQFIAADQTFYLRLSIDEAMDRLRKRKGEKDAYEKKEKLEKIMQGYEWLVNQFPDQFIIIDSEQSIEKVTKEIIAKIENFR